jgi:hypothetical protein
VIVSLLFPLVILAAVMALARRRWRRAALARAARGRAGGSLEHAIYVRSFTEIDEQLGARWCTCGGYLERTGEGSRDGFGRRYRIVRLRCQECERVDEVFFDTTEVVH